MLYRDAGAETAARRFRRPWARAELSGPMARENRSKSQAGEVDVDPVPDRVQQLVGGLDLGHMTAVIEYLKPGLRDGGRIGAPVVGVDDPVTVAPKHEGRRLHRREALDESGVAHRRTGVDGEGGAITGSDL